VGGSGERGCPGGPCSDSAGVSVEIPGVTDADANVAGWGGVATADGTVVAAAAGMLPNHISLACCCGWAAGAPGIPWLAE
jgi:hypothetical protein